MTPSTTETDKKKKLDMKCVKEIEPDVITSKELKMAAKELGFKEGRLIAASRNDKIYHTKRGMGLYLKMPQWGTKFPLSHFIKQTLCILRIPPSQLSGTAWCYMSSFEAIFQLYKKDFESSLLRRPTLPIFLFYFSFQPDRSWVTVRVTKNKLFNQFSKVDKAVNKYMYLPLEEEDYSWCNYLPIKWREEVTMPGRRNLTSHEKFALNIIETIRLRKLLKVLISSY